MIDKEGAVSPDDLAERRVTITTEINRLVVAGKSYDSLRPGTVISVPKWAAEKLIERGICEYQAPSLNASTIAQIEWRERRNSSELSEVPPSFYDEVRSLLKGDPQSYHKDLGARVINVVSMRISKILTFAVKGVPPEKIKNLTSEELDLYLSSRKDFVNWLKKNTGLGEV
ncbi:MAG: DNA replication complex GINS family protein [Aigarchaeota archaeon]|nr:DNA replication complex GINS family protein [Aigarchaeota archaeon]MDW8092916.1 hypothetical protein [Nitrososphaerota archaeon]